ncbi:sigma-70 family RNA polymerase sigma factor [Nocardiopsis sp. CT-R113]|uniref:Sigma-70 family RNA polymerase sigma factor n=1 Tax=Nocardiopsis codii TaxID=3065942 RepID=A0ABU7K9P5_9ACTN|nr:sigma-70 family RNA polymerase sigma factor [Nocardiopsis sp. CT-R113]MEE2038945.1 sigma-70 family RNA polymerase sigma factor [Nocardiopsis sp. CT-R113]
MTFSPSPLAVVNTAFAELAPTHLLLHGAACHSWLQDRTYSLYELRDVLMDEGTPHEVRDEVWRHTIRAARLSQDWMVGALGLCIPALRSTARRTCRGLDPGGVDAVESAIVCEAIHQVRTINLNYARMAWYLTRPVHRAALTARKREKDAPIPTGDPGRQEDLDPGAAASPELLLVSAVRVGVLSRSEARLIARTRLENAPLAEIAEQDGVSYKALAKRRERAEARLVAAVHSGGVVIADALIRPDDLSAHKRGSLRLLAGAPTRGKSLSHPPLPVAS